MIDGMNSRRYGGQSQFGRLSAQVRKIVDA
jgi:hypothetical protein